MYIVLMAVLCYYFFLAYHFIPPALRRTPLKRGQLPHDAVYHMLE